MKKNIGMFAAGVLYIILLLYSAGFHLSQLISLKNIVLVAGGAFVLTLPDALEYTDIKHIFHIYSRNALISGYISTFIMIMGSLYKTEDISSVMPDIALNCRNIIYGFLLYLLFRKEDMEENEEQTHTTPSPDEEQAQLLSLGLTRREIEVFWLIRKNYTNGEIAEELFIAENTVKKHISNIFHKLDVENRQALKQYKL